MSAIRCWTSCIAALAAQFVHHLRRELAALQQRLQQRGLQRVQRTVVLIAGPAPPRVVVGAAVEAALQQEVRESLQQILDVERVENVPWYF
jgi:hypothetical protein